VSGSTRILGIAGSLRRESFNKAALRAAQKLVPQGTTLDVFDIDGLPLFNQDDEKSPPAKVVELKRRIREADAILFVTPEYNRSIPGVLKNAIDVASRPYGQSAWERKPRMVASCSPGAIGGFGSNHHLRQCLVFLQMPVMQMEAYVGGVSKLVNEQGQVTGDDTRDFLTKIMQAFGAWIEANAAK